MVVVVHVPLPPVFIGVPAHPQFPSSTSFVVFALPSLHAVPATGQLGISVPAHPQFPSSTSFIVFALPSLHAVPATGHDGPLLPPPTQPIISNSAIPRK